MKKHLSLAAVIILPVILLTGCPKRTTIAQLESDPGRFRGQDVLISGTVTNSFGAFGQGI